jgi:hypothetical protein
MASSDRGQSGNGALRTLLRRMPFPVTRVELLAAAVRNCLDPATCRRLQRLDEHEYGTPAEVFAGLRGERPALI